jgi:predicted transcriptional regulator
MGWYQSGAIPNGDLSCRSELTGYGVFPARMGKHKMPDEQNQLQLATEIVSAYVGHNQVTADQLPSLISTVHQALGQLGTPATEPVVERTPAVPVRQSVRRDYVVCLDCGYRAKMLRRHLASIHGLSVEQYRGRWSLRADHPVTAPAYSEHRSTMAKQLGLGRPRGASIETTAMPETETATARQPKRRGRPRSAAEQARTQPD